MPVVISIEGIGIVDPMLASQIIELGKVAGIAEQEVDIGIAGKGGWRKLRGSLGIRLQLLVLDGAHVTEAKLELVQPLIPGQIIPDLIAVERVPPWKIARAPG